MKIIKTIEQTIQQEIIEDIICNKCGNSCVNNTIDSGQVLLAEGLIEKEIHCGYYSKMGDGNIYQFSLCEDCLIELFKTFKHDPLIGDNFAVFIQDEKYN